MGNSVELDRLRFFAKLEEFHSRLSRTEDWQHLRKRLHPRELVWQSHDDGGGMAVANVVVAYGVNCMTNCLRIICVSASFVTCYLLAALSAFGAGSQPVLLAGHQDAVYDVAFSPDGCLLASGSYDRTVKLWNIADRSLIATLSGHTDQVFRVEFSPDGKSLASCGGDGKVIVWDVKTHQALTVLTDRGDPMIDVAYSTDGNLVATAGPHIQLWKSTKQVWSTPHSPLYFSIAVSPDHQSLACGTKDLIRIFDIANPESWIDLSDVKGIVYQVDYSPDGHWLASASSDGRLEVWDATLRKSHQAVTADNSALFSTAFSPDGQTLMTGGRERVIRTWSVPELQLIEERYGPRETILAVSFSPSGKQIASGSYDGSVHLWSLE